MSSPHERIRALERMRWQETKVAQAAEPIQRAVREQLGSDAPSDTLALLDRNERWWVALPEGTATPLTIEGIPIVAEVLKAIGPPALDFEVTPLLADALVNYERELRALNTLRREADKAG